LVADVQQSGASNLVTEMLLHLIKNEQASYHENRLKSIADAIYLFERFEELPESPSSPPTPILFL